MLLTGLLAFIGALYFKHDNRPYLAGILMGLSVVFVLIAMLLLILETLQAQVVR